MPSAQSLYDLHAFHGHFSKATRSALAAHGLDQTFLARDRGTLPASYITISFELGEPFEETPHPAQPGLGMVDSHFAAQLTIGIRSERLEDAPSFMPGIDDLHAEMEAKTRVAMLPISDPFPASRLPYYQVIEITPSSTRRQTDPTFMEDFTELVFRLRFGIRAESWPAVA